MGGLCRPRHPGFGALDAGPTSSSSPPAPFGLRGVWVVAAREKRATRHMRCSGVNRGVRLTGSTGFLTRIRPRGAWPATVMENEMALTKSEVLASLDAVASRP